MIRAPNSLAVKPASQKQVPVTYPGSAEGKILTFDFVSQWFGQWEEFFVTDNLGLNNRLLPISSHAGFGFRFFCEPNHAFNLHFMP